jgi:serine/threonine protein kinase
MNPPLLADPRRSASPNAGLASDIKSRWFHGEPPDAAGALERHPELKDDKSAVVELALEEYCLRRQRGEALDPEEFSSRFPGFQSSLLTVLLSDGMLALSGSVLADEPLSAPPEYWPAPGEKFAAGRLTLLRELGRGTFARVYLAVEGPTGDRPVAVKLTREGGGEAKALGRLRHDHIVPVLWAGRDEATDLQTTCMPWLGGATLLDVLDRAYPRAEQRPPREGAVILEALRRRVRPDDPAPDYSPPAPDLTRLSFAAAVMRLAEPLADALAFLQERGLVHCDLKPANILLTPAGAPLLLDFNLALTPRSWSPRLGGTFPYMAPEQLQAFLAKRRLPPPQGAGADLFSLGVVLYEWLTGRHPFDAPPAGEAEAVASWVLERQKQGFRPVDELNPDVPGPAARLLERMLSLDASRRPAAAAVAAELRRMRRPSPWRVPLASALLLAGLTFAAIPFSRSTSDPDGVPPPRETAHERLASGWKRLARGEQAGAAPLFREANQAFTRAIDGALREPERRPDWRDYAGRGRALMLLGEAKSASDDLHEADRLFREQALPAAPDRLAHARVLACLSYCLTLRGKHAQARLMGEKALAGGFRSPGLLNNLAYSHLQGGADLDKAGRYLTEALRRDPRLLPPLRNRAALVLQRSLLVGRPAGSGVPAWALDEVDQLIRRSPKKENEEPAALYLQAARLYARAAGDARRQDRVEAPDVEARARGAFREQRAYDYLCRAYELGAVPQDGDLILAAALGKERLAEVRKGVRANSRAEKPAVHTYLLDPLGTAFP